MIPAAAPKTAALRGVLAELAAHDGDVGEQPLIAAPTWSLSAEAAGLDAVACGMVLGAQ